MKFHSTNYCNTFIEIAEDCPTMKSEIPPLKGNKISIANYQFDLIYNNPYKYTSDEIFFKIYALRKGLLAGDIESERENFFSKGQPCFRASSLTKRYGWGIHNDANGKIALIELNSETYDSFIKNESVIKVKAMRSKRKK